MSFQAGNESHYIGDILHVGPTKLMSTIAPQIQNKYVRLKYTSNTTVRYYSIRPVFKSHYKKT